MNESGEQSKFEQKKRPYETVQEIPLTELHPFKNHPFKVINNERMMDTAQSIEDHGVLVPAIARPRVGGGFELIAGHRRKRACELAGLVTMPVIVRDLDDYAATVMMVDTNLQRENILPSERAFAYKMKLNAIKCQGKRTDLTSRQVGEKLVMADIVGKDTGESGRQVQRYIRLTELIPALLDLVDAKQIAFSPAVELSYLTSKEQEQIIDAMESEQTRPSLAQAKEIRKLSTTRRLTFDAMCLIMREKRDERKITIDVDTVGQYFPKSFSPKQMEKTIIELLQQWQRKRQMKYQR